MRSLRSPRTFAVRAVALGAVSLFWSACGEEDLTAPEDGQIRVTTSTAGSPEDPDGYGLEVDGGEPRAIGANASITLTDLSPGDHVVRLTGLAENCAVVGENPLTIAVPEGETVELRFEITCAATAGGLTVTTTTNGSGTDPDGYTVRLNDAAEQPIGTSATLTLPDLSPGDYAVTLGGIAAHCQAEGDNPRTVAVTAGARAEVAFTVTCVSGVRQWTPMVSGTTADLPEVWGTSSSDVFVVGELPLNDDFDVASVILRFDGTAWTRQLRQSDLVLRGVWGSSATDVYAVGFDFSSSNAALLRYDGVRWNDVPGFTSDFEELLFHGIWGSSASDVFAVGSAFDGQFDRSLIYHFDGATWERMPEPAEIAPILEDVWGSSPTDVYAVGRDDVADQGPGVILRYDGSAWLPVFEEENMSLTSVWGSSATDVFAAGFRVEEDGDEFEVIGTILHYDGTRWSRMRLPRAGLLSDLWGTSATDVFAVGDDGVVLHYDGVAWTSSNPTRRALLGVWGSSPSDVFAVGERGIILRGTP